MAESEPVRRSRASVRPVLGIRRCAYFNMRTANQSDSDWAGRGPAGEARLFNFKLRILRPCKLGPAELMMRNAQVASGVGAMLPGE